MWESLRSVELANSYAATRRNRMPLTYSVHMWRNTNRLKRQHCARTRTASSSCATHTLTATVLHEPTHPIHASCFGHGAISEPTSPTLIAVRTQVNPMTHHHASPKARPVHASLEVAECRVTLRGLDQTFPMGPIRADTDGSCK